MIEKTFAFHKPSNLSLPKIQAIREGFTTLKQLIQDNAPPSRERSVALTELETSAMWSIKAVVSNDPLSEPVLG